MVDNPCRARRRSAEIDQRVVREIAINLSHDIRSLVNAPSPRRNASGRLEVHVHGGIAGDTLVVVDLIPRAPDGSLQ